MDSDVYLINATQEVPSGVVFDLYNSEAGTPESPFRVAGAARDHNHLLCRVIAIVAPIAGHGEKIYRQFIPTTSVLPIHIRYKI